MNRDTGRVLSGLDHLRQSIADILTTPVGSRVMRRDYGSILPELIDQPFNDTTRLRAYSAIAMALMRWERRIQLTAVRLTQSDQPGSAVLDLEGAEVDSNATFNLSVPLQLGGL